MLQIRACLEGHHERESNVVGAVPGGVNLKGDVMTKSWCARAALVLVVAAGFAVAGCSSKDPNTCKVTCSADSDCPTGQNCSAVGLCTSGETCSCTPGEFHDCSGSAARVCNAAGDGFDAQDCGASGCNADAGRCNACVADTLGCSADSTTLDQCGSDGLVATTESCAAGCAPAAGSDAPRCKHIAPAWLPNVCDDLAATPQASLGSATLDTTQDASCTGGIVQSGTTNICVVRAGKIDIADLKVTGTRAIAFVADDELTVTGTLDVSADGSTAGPGAGALGAGTNTNASYQGAGGAGFSQVGGAGGGNETGTIGGQPGGGVTTRPTAMPFVGGAYGGYSDCGSTTICRVNGRSFPGGGGGGGTLLIACRGTVSVAGIVDASGGGGAGGGDYFPGSGTTQGGGAAGGSGGFVVFQGVQVSITGKLYSNGGGGGAGCGTDDCQANPGSDGSTSTAGAPGGAANGTTNGGGIGGSLLQTPGAGEKTFASASAGAGGGGGATGRFQVFTPVGVSPTITPVEASPTLDPSATVPVE